MSRYNRNDDAEADHEAALYGTCDECGRRLPICTCPIQFATTVDTDGWEALMDFCVGAPTNPTEKKDP